MYPIQVSIFAIHIVRPFSSVYSIIKFHWNQIRRKLTDILTFCILFNLLIPHAKLFLYGLAYMFTWNIKYRDRAEHGCYMLGCIDRMKCFMSLLTDDTLPVHQTMNSTSLAWLHEFSYFFSYTIVEKKGVCSHLYLNALMSTCTYKV